MRADTHHRFFDKSTTRTLKLSKRKCAVDDTLVRSESGANAIQKHTKRTAKEPQDIPEEAAKYLSHEHWGPNKSED